MFLHSSLRCQPSTVGVLTDNILTNDQICEWIASTVSEFRYARQHGVFTNRTSEQRESLLQPETSTSPPTSVVSPPQASTSDKDNENKQSSNMTVSQRGCVTVGQSPEEDGLRTTTKSSSEKKEHSQSLSEVSSTHEKKDEQSPVVNSTIDIFISDELIKESSRTVDGNSSDGTPNFPILIDSQYENISDVEEPSGLTDSFLSVERCEDASEDEHQGSGKGVGKMGCTPPVVSEACSKTLENVQIYDSPKTPTFDEITDVHSPYSVESADESEHHLCIERDLGGQTNHFYEEFSNESDEESEDEFEVIPIIMSDLNPELVEEEPALEKVMQHGGDHENQLNQHGVDARQSCAPKPVPASAFLKMAIFDTPGDQEQAIRCGQLSFVTLSCGSPLSKSGQGEDSCSYSSDPECNYMTVSKELYKSISSAQRNLDHCILKNREDMQTPPDDDIIDILNLDTDDDHCESEMKKRSQTSENAKQNDESVVIILSDSDEEEREKYNVAKMASTATSVDYGRGSSRQDMNTAIHEVATLDKNQKSSRSRLSRQQSDNEDPTKEVISVEASTSLSSDSDDFSNAGVNAVVPERKKRRTAFSHPRRLSEADVTKNFCIIERMIVKVSKSDKPATLVRVPRDPRQGPRESMPMAKSSFTERDGIKEQPDKPASIPHAEAHKTSCRRIMHASPSPSSYNPLATDHCFPPARFPSSSAPVQSMQVTNHARTKVFRTWKDQHVPLRREKKRKRTNTFRHRR